MDACTEDWTHDVRITFPGEPMERWAVCRVHESQLKATAVRRRPKKPAQVTESPAAVIYCGGCHAVIADPQSQACPACGSGDRAIRAYERASMTEHQFVRKRTLEPGKKGGWMVEVSSGDSYTVELEGWGTLDRTKARDRDVYEEVIHLWDGTRIESRARLSKHPHPPDAR